MQYTSFFFLSAISSSDISDHLYIFTITRQRHGRINSKYIYTVINVATVIKLTKLVVRALKRYVTVMIQVLHTF